MAPTPASAPSARPRDLEVWWKTDSDRWPLAPKGHYIGPDGRLLSPGEFAAYASSPARLVVVIDSSTRYQTAVRR
ncbi:MAG: hypothetical protein K6V36_02105 [Anaerolineae bacterium]|nr:hypothetical protein [Anaerolineae bacterium]